MRGRRALLDELTRFKIEVEHARDEEVKANAQSLLALVNEIFDITHIESHEMGVVLGQQWWLRPLPATIK